MSVCLQKKFRKVFSRNMYTVQAQYGQEMYLQTRKQQPSLKVLELPLWFTHSVDVNFVYDTLTIWL